MMRLRPTILTMLLTALLAGAAVMVYATPGDPPFPEEYEKRIGREAAKQVEDEYDRYEDEEAQAKLDAMVAEIAAATPRPDVEYDVRLLDTEIVNAFSLPGGTIYVTKGLLEEVGSDHELAGVLAHEIAHNCTYDALRQAQRNESMFQTSVAALIASILLGAPSDMVSTVMIAGEYVRRGILGGYSIKMETAADAHAVEYIVRTSYNPVGLVTFMERLAAKYRSKPQFELGFLQTHPDAPDRVNDLKKLLHDAGIEINRRAATDWQRPVAEEVEQEGGCAFVRVSLRELEILRVMAAGPDHETPMQRAEAIVERLTSVMESGMQSYQLQIGRNGDNPVLAASGRILLTIYPDDAEALELSQDEIAAQARFAILEALRRERLERIY
ncbi:MAG: M48 family metalloprotease [Armatimonadota bacterium]|jgi:Zn-dependent protease with chaperone function